MVAGPVLTLFSTSKDGDRERAGEEGKSQMLEDGGEAQMLRGRITIKQTQSETGTLPLYIHSCLGTARGNPAFVGNEAHEGE